MERPQWQAIATAPQDESQILVYGYLAGEIQTYKPNVKVVSKVFWDGSGWEVCDTCGYSCWILEPSHWMPLPTPQEKD